MVWFRLEYEKPGRIRRLGLGWNMRNLVGLDGLDQWRSLSHGEASPRTEILYNIGEIHFLMYNLLLNLFYP